MKLTTLCSLMLLVTSNLSVAKPTIPLNELIGQFDEKKHPDFIALDTTILPVNKPNMYLRKIAADNLIQAYQAFKRDYPDIPFIVVSATRNYYYQNFIWQRKWHSAYPKYYNSRKTAHEILNYSAMPGTSRHHWGTDIDITSIEPDYFYNDPKGKILFTWLNKNMPKYGFCQTYTDDRNRGYKPEAWHWSYKPLASDFLADYRYYIKQHPEKIINKLDFAGHDNINLQAIIEEYVFAINKNCY